MVDSPYLSESLEFDAQVIVCLLERLQRVSSTITYGDLAGEMSSKFDLEDARAWHYFDAALGRIQDSCEQLDLPSLPVMVVRKSGMQPGTGFASYYRTKHPECEEMTDKQIAQQQWKLVRECPDWQKLLDYYDIDMAFEGPKDYIAELRAEESYEEARRIVRAVRDEAERSPEARRRCLEIKGESCVVCGFNSEDQYGVKGIIHVHHLRPLFEAVAGETVKTDPSKDLVPVCPNCHALIHSKGTRECYSIDEAREFVLKARVAE